MANLVRRTATPDPEELMISDSEPEDLAPEELETDCEDLELRSGCQITSTPNASLLSPEQVDSTVSTPCQSFGSNSGSDETLMALLLETNAIVKTFDARLATLEAKVDLLGDKGKGMAQEKRKVAVTDEIRVRHSVMKVIIIL